MSARDNILGRLRRAPAGSTAPLPDLAAWRASRAPIGDALALFRANIEAARAEVHDTTLEDWPALLNRLCSAKGVRSLLYGPATKHGAQLAAQECGQPATVRGEPVEPHLPCNDRPSTALCAPGIPLRGPASGRTVSSETKESSFRRTPESSAAPHSIPDRVRNDGATNCHLVPYERPVHLWREQLFDGIDASLTAAVSAIADTGSLILWPDAAEPRLMSLVPPIHFVLLDATRIHRDLYAAMQAEHWASRMPTNALVISGPSKTADIQQTLAYGAHGPRELIVLLCHASGEPS